MGQLHELLLIMLFLYRFLDQEELMVRSVN